MNICHAILEIYYTMLIVTYIYNRYYDFWHYIFNFDAAWVEYLIFYGHGKRFIVELFFLGLEESSLQPLLPLRKFGWMLYEPIIYWSDVVYPAFVNLFIFPIYVPVFFIIWVDWALVLIGDTYYMYFFKEVNGISPFFSFAT